MFVSSTFMGMQGVRDYLCRQVFPRIIDYCNSMNVLFSVVDLRWGITEEETSRGKITELCLRELDNCHPYFLGLVGKRYGTIPQENSESFFDENKKSFFDNNQGKSYTELEFLWNSLYDNFKDFSSIFFIGNISSDDGSDSSDGEINDFLNRTKILYGQENVFDSTLSFEDLGEKILSRLKLYVDSVVCGKTYTEIEAQELSNLRQAKQISKNGFKQLRYLNAIEDYISNGGKPLILCSDEGYGKSSLLAYSYLSLLERGKRAHIRFWASSDTFLDDLFINLRHAIDGTEPEVKEPTRIMLKEGITGGFDEKVNETINGNTFEVRNPKILAAVFAKMIESCILTDEVVTIFVDDIDKYTSPENSNIFSSFLREMPESVRLIFTVSSNYDLSGIDKRYINCWNILRLDALDIDMVADCAQEMLSHFGKRLSESQIIALKKNQDLYKPRNLLYCTAGINLSPCYSQVEKAIYEFTDADFRFQHFFSLCDNKSANRILTVIACSETGFSEEQLKVIFKKKDSILKNLFHVLNIFSLFFIKGRHGEIFINDPRFKKQLLSDKQEVTVSRNLILKRLSAFPKSDYKQSLYEECHQLFEQDDFSKLADKVFNIRIANILQMEKRSNYRKYLDRLIRYSKNYAMSLLRSLAQLKDSDFTRYGLAVMDMATCLSNCGYDKHALYIMLIYEGEYSKLLGEFSPLICTTYCQMFDLAINSGYLTFADSILCHLYHIIINNTSEEDFFNKFHHWSLRSVAESLYQGGVALGKEHYKEFAKTLLLAAKQYDGIGMSFDDSVYIDKIENIKDAGEFDVSEYDVLVGNKVCIYVPKCFIANRDSKVVGMNSKLFSFQDKEGAYRSKIYSVLQKIIDDGLVQPQHNQVDKLLENNYILKHRECDKIGLFYKIRKLVPLRHGICYDMTENEITLSCANNSQTLKPPLILVWLYSDGKRSVEEIADMIYQTFQTPDFLIIQKEISDGVYQLFRSNLITIEGEIQ